MKEFIRSHGLLITQKDASRIAKVTPGRICQMVASGKLESVRTQATRRKMVTADSLYRYIYKRENADAIRRKSRREYAERKLVELLLEYVEDIKDGDCPGFWEVNSAVRTFERARLAYVNDHPFDTYGDKEVSI